jgi:hypothetical protein
MKLSQKWSLRFFVLENRRLYFSDGKNGYPDSKEGTLSYVRSNPQPGRRYCVDLAGASACASSQAMQSVTSFAGCTVELCREPIDGQTFAFEIKFPPGSQVLLVHWMHRVQNFAIWHRSQPCHLTGKRLAPCCR